MRVTTEATGSCRRVLNVEVEPDTVAREYADVLKEFMAAAQLPGFRRGRAPAAMVERRYGAEIWDEVRGRLVPRCYREAVAQESLSPVAVVEVKDVKTRPGEGLTFRVTVDIPPLFDLPPYRGLVVSGQSTEVSDAMVEEALQDLRERAATYVPAKERPAAAGDLAEVDFTGVCEGKPVADWVPLVPRVGKGTHVQVLVGMPFYVPGLGEGLVGAAVGETRKVPVAFPADHRVEALRGRQAEYEVTVTSLRERRLPEVDEAFCKELGKDSPEALKASLRSELKELAEGRERARRRNEVVRQLLERTALDAPESEVAEESRHLIQEIVRGSAAQGMTREQIMDRRDDILGRATRSSQERVKADYILNAIADAEKITVEDKVVDEVVAGMAKRHQADPARLRQQLESRGAIERIRRDLRIQAALERVVSQAQVVTEQPAETGERA